jgi:hypothetical protein
MFDNFDWFLFICVTISLAIGYFVGLGRGGIAGYDMANEENDNAKKILNITLEVAEDGTIIMEELGSNRFICSGKDIESCVKYVNEKYKDAIRVYSSKTQVEASNK